MALAGGAAASFRFKRQSAECAGVAQGIGGRAFGRLRCGAVPTLKVLPGIAKDSHGEPMVSGEWVVVIVLPRKDGTGEVNVTVRG